MIAGQPGPSPFDLSAALPSGTVVLEASAGTGKTFTIAGLAARWVAETEIRLPELLVVTFTRAATAELRDRVRARLVEAADHVERVLIGAEVPGDDPVLAALTGGVVEAELERRRSRLRRAISDVDAATIATIHGFCRDVLDGIGIAGDLDRDAELVDDVGDLVEEVVDDLLVATYLEPGDRPRIPRDTLLEVGRGVVANPSTHLAPRGTEDPTAAIRVHLAQRIRREVARRARQRRLLSYDDLLTRLDATLRDPERGAAARASLRQRYRVALIDEFQDTDPVQWSIVSRAFAEARDDHDAGGRALVLIGDPKQAIYAFRGADVHAYLQAARSAGRRHTLDTSWRADGGLVTAFGALFDGVRFGHEEIPYRHLRPAPGHEDPRLLGAPRPAPLRLRLVPRHPSLPMWRGRPNAGKVRELIATDLAADVVRLLDAHPVLLQRDHDGEETERRGLVPGDIAVLVRSHQEAALVQDLLREAAVPAVVGGAGSVFATAAATDWRRLLDALERPASGTRVRALALSNWVGWSGDDLVAADEHRWDELHEDVHRWSRLLEEHGVATMFRDVQLRRELPRRLLATVGGERLLADLEHIAELAHAAVAAEHLGPAGLSAWFRERAAEAPRDTQEDRLRRLETDHEAVQVLTVHRSKGLEYPVVYCPFLWSSGPGVRGAPVFHDQGGRRHLDVGGETHPDHRANLETAEEELRAEELRLLYVALTRARHQVVAWYAPAGRPEWSGLGRLLLCRDTEGRPCTDQPVPSLDDDELAEAVAGVASTAGDAIAVETVPEQPVVTRWERDGGPEVWLDRARFTRHLDDRWHRTSYSALTRHDDPLPRVASEPDEAVKDDETVGTAVISRADLHGGEDPHGLRQIPAPLAGMPGGTEVGTFVHGVLERTDFAAQDLDAELGAAVAAELRRRRLELDPGEVVSGLAAAVRTPLGPDTGGGALRSVDRTDRRDEVAFELPLDHADTGGRPPVLGDLAELVATHLPAHDPLRHYPETLPEPLLRRRLRGFLAGSIDLVIRRTSGAHPVFHVADYKTNRLGAPGEPLTAWDYRQEALVAAMTHGHYPIQALLYAVALHRMLRWRLPGYDPERNLGAVLYLFVRGMTGADAPSPRGRPCGVFAWSPPPALVLGVSDLLHGERG